MVKDIKPKYSIAKYSIDALPSAESIEGLSEADLDDPVITQSKGIRQKD